MRKYIIERIIPEIGCAERAELRAIARRSNETLRTIGPDVQWIESYVAENKTYCVYLAASEEIIRRYIEIDDFPADVITEIVAVIDPTSADSQDPPFDG
jgi:hypothetical protein